MPPKSILATIFIVAFFCFSHYFYNENKLNQYKNVSALIIAGPELYSSSSSSSNNTTDINRDVANNNIIEVQPLTTVKKGALDLNKNVSSSYSKDPYFPEYHSFGYFFDGEKKRESFFVSGYHVSKISFNNAYLDIIVSNQEFGVFLEKGSCYLGSLVLTSGQSFAYFYDKNDFYEGYCVCNREYCKIEKL